jgi:hypothetical protein
MMKEEMGTESKSELPCGLFGQKCCRPIHCSTGLRAANSSLTTISYILFRLGQINGNTAGLTRSDLALSTATVQRLHEEVIQFGLG